MVGDSFLIESNQRVIDQPYLLYIPAPNFVSEHGKQHNSQGYRGKSVPLAKDPAVTRILCLGGSTTYGYGVPKPEQAYPAILERMINEAGFKKFGRVEVMNGGIPFGTSAEILTHYLFKYRYYKPDLVILNTGGNDAITTFQPYYHPDYSHVRKKMNLLGEVPSLGKFFLRSRLVSLMVIPIFYGSNPSVNLFYSRRGRQPDAYWFKRIESNELFEKITHLPLDEIAMYRNINSFIDQLNSDGVRLLIVPFHSNPRKPVVTPKFLGYSLNILKKIAQERGIKYAPLDPKIFSPENWVDSSHLKEKGNVIKAQFLLPYVKELLH